MIRMSVIEHQEMFKGRIYPVDKGIDGKLILK
jgi:hypothetical protein